MSINAPGQYSGYTPPPPPKAPTSPWVWVLLGCGGLMVLTVGGCLIAGAVVYNKAKQALSEPYNAAAEEKELGDVPRYPGATQNTDLSKAMRFVAGVHKMAFHADKVVEVAYDTPDTFFKVVGWYETQLKQAGYSAGKDRNGLYLYSKGSDLVALQDLAGKSATGHGFLLIHATGAKTPDGG